ncbi:hypothetical protein [Bradyrhizobium sp. SEMIA]|uniref:hypothetical protein n=1 Tax=Bradyrhizobium sp. SEMIA TaxID=2597515 RepID=UPI002240E29F|nr:hypothetical protein [Bradyrhizobium sp. SEMIA]
MIRCVRLWTGEDNNSHFEEGYLELEPGQRGDFLTGKIDALSVSFQETESGGAFAWHTAPVRQSCSR